MESDLWKGISINTQTKIMNLMKFFIIYFWWNLIFRMYFLKWVLIPVKQTFL
jgi:hypothetical protein